MPQQTNASGKGEYVPSPEDIASACDEIRSQWSEAERYRRSGQQQRLDVTRATDHRHASGQNRRLYG